MNKLSTRDNKRLAVPSITPANASCISSDFILRSELPEEIPFWGVYHGLAGLTKYIALFQEEIEVVFLEEKSYYPSGYSVVIEFDAELRIKRNGQSALCTCTDIYVVRKEQIVALTRTIADSENLVKILVGTI